MKNTILGCLISIGVMTGCASISTSSDYVLGADFSGLKTYAWVAGAQAVTGDPRIDNTLTDSRVRSAVERSLEAKGFQKSESGAPDFLVGYQAAIEGKTDVTTMNMPYSVPSSRDILSGNMNTWDLAYGGTQTFVSQYEEGSLIIDVVNPKTNQLMWRGTGKATVLENASPEKRVERINQGVEKILSDFPPV